MRGELGASRKVRIQELNRQTTDKLFGPPSVPV